MRSNSVFQLKSDVRGDGAWWVRVMTGYKRRRRIMFFIDIIVMYCRWTKLIYFVFKQVYGVFIALRLYLRQYPYI
jgi:hypothetical protein